MTLRQQAFAIVASVALLIFIVEMVRRRRLREEYSWLWIATGVAIFVLSVWFGLLEWLTGLIGAVVPVSTLFVFGILFLLATNIYFSIKVSTLTTQVKNLAQKLALVDHYVEAMRQEQGTPPPEPCACDDEPAPVSEPAAQPAPATELSMELPS